MSGEVPGRDHHLRGAVGKPEILSSRPELADVWAPADSHFPVRVTRSWWSRTRPEDPTDPLALQVLPSPEELAFNDHDLPDPVGELELSPVPWVVHKHADRVLLLMTKRCHVYCRYCFRRGHKPEERLDPSARAWEAALKYAVQSGATEAILSGGDPLMVSDKRLFSTIDQLQQAISVVRVHTRAPITYPARVTADLVEGLRRRRPVWVLVHANHPNELSSDVDVALARLVDAGIPVLNQAVLLRGVNADADVLAALSTALVRRGIKPYYLHHTDHAVGNSAFRVSLGDGLSIYRRLRGLVSGVALPRYVIDPPDGSGKVDVEEFVRR